MANIKIPKYVDKQAARDFLLRNYTIVQIAEELVDYLQQKDTEKITITVEQFHQFFKIRGVAGFNLDKNTVVLEKRGRKPLSPLAQRRLMEKQQMAAAMGKEIDELEYPMPSSRKEAEAKKKSK